jgi:hypothetical protein
MPHPSALLPHQHQALAQALADAIFYRDPPLNCAACDALQGSLCKQCTDTLTLARAHLHLADDLGIDVEP